MGWKVPKFSKVGSISLFRRAEISSVAYESIGLSLHRVNKDSKHIYGQ